MMKPYISPLTIEKVVVGAYGKKTRYAIMDGNGGQLIRLDRLFDAAVCLRFMMGKSMSRTECDLAEQLLKEQDEKGEKADEQSISTKQAETDVERI